MYVRSWQGVSISDILLKVIVEFSQRQVCVFENETGRYHSWDGRKRVAGGMGGLSEVNSWEEMRQNTLR